MSDTKQPTFGIEKIYLTDCSLENPNAPASFLIKEDPKMDLSIDPSYKKIDDSHYEVSVRATVSAKMATEDKTLFICEVTQSGVFLIENMPPEELDIILNAVAPNILFPYLRHAVSLITSSGGFPSINLAPFNFEMYYQDRKNREAAGATNSIQ